MQSTTLRGLDLLDPTDNWCSNHKNTSEILHCRNLIAYVRVVESMLHDGDVSLCRVQIGGWAMRDPGVGD